VVDVDGWTLSAGSGDGVAFAAAQDIHEQYEQELQLLP
jgi:hypothetical protein